MERKEYVSPKMNVVLLDDAKVFLAVSIDSGDGNGEGGGIPDWE